MLGKRESKIILLLFTLSVSIEASICPEARKPHVTSCTIFYNCINLPEGGYVWVPAKCTEGLVFQPYLRICVLPGDTWTCDESSTEKPILTDHLEKPQLSNPSRTSYYGYEQNSKTTGNPSIDYFYAINDHSSLGNIRPSVDPYPLIEISNDDEETSSPTKMINSMADKNHREVENYLSEFFKSQERLRTRLNGVSSINEGKKSKFTWLRGIVDRILLYEDYEATSATCRSNDSKKNQQYDDSSRDILKYLVESYVLGTRNPIGDKSKKIQRKSATTERIKSMENRVITTANGILNDDHNESLISESKLDNNIVVIEGNLGEKEYITVNRYKSLSGQINLRIIEILPCARGVRLPNFTDCTKYYTCDPENGNIVEFSCPSKTAFNNYTRICDVERYKICWRRLDERYEETTENFFTTEAISFSKGTEISEANEPCRNTGKFVDYISEKHYYVCYSSQANPSKIESLRMTCPNDLIFCPERRVCSTRKRCYDN